MRTGTLLTWAIGLVLCCASASAAAARVCPIQISQPLIPRVRSNGDASIALILHDAVERSPTFRHLVDTINGTDGIVYIEPGTCRHVRACLLMSVTIAGPNRVLHIRVDTHDDTVTVIARLGHELQHAVEALSEVAVRSDGLIEAFFERLSGTPTSRGQLEFETDAALKIGDAIRLDVETYIQNRHVRSNDAAILRLIDRGELRSETFRHLVDALNATDVIVHVEPKSKVNGLGGYLVHQMTVAGQQRYLRVVVRFSGSDDRLTALVAHELQHAKEVAGASDVRNDEGLRRFFERFGQTSNCLAERECYETQDATDIERTVLTELRASNDHPVRR
jgi:hypothetical protein